jgi:pimeloyl-ACP methyl ester carboxylesterase
MIPVFLHGLESSSMGTKGRWFRARYPEMLIPDFSGSLAERMKDLGNLLTERSELVLVGSSFGGLMAALYTIGNPADVSRIILLAPAFNFPEFEKCRQQSTTVPAVLYTGDHDAVCPPDLVIPAAAEVFSDLTVHRVDDDHLLHHTFSRIDWSSLLR